jgi:hypothetical protein
MIYSGFPLYRNTSNSLKNSRILENNQLQHFLRTHQIGNDESIESPFIKFQDTQRIQTTIFDTLTLLDSRFIHLLYSYLQDIHNKYKLQEFLEFVTKYRGVLECYEQPHQFIQDFQNAFQIMRLNSNETLSLIPRYAGKNGGSFMFYASESLSEESLSRTLRELERSYPKISLEFANFRDGIEKSNIQLIKNLYSTSKKDVSGKRMMVLTQENGQRQFFGEHEFQIHNSQQIILDLSDDKIYIR